MAFRKPHDVHVRRFSRNLGLGLVLAAFVALVFGLTIAKVGTDNPTPTATSAKTAQAQDASQ